MHHSTCSSSVSTPPCSRIPTCSYVLQRGSFCLGAAVHGRSYCRHHLSIRIRLRRMARSRRKTPVPQVSLIDAVAIRQTEIRLRVALADHRIDPAAGTMISWALRMARGLARTIDRYEKTAHQPNQKQPLKPNKINQIPISFLDSSAYLKNDTQLTETNNSGGGVNFEARQAKSEERRATSEERKERKANSE